MKLETEAPSWIDEIADWFLEAQAQLTVILPVRGLPFPTDYFEGACFLVARLAKSRGAEIFPVTTFLGYLGALAVFEEIPLLSAFEIDRARLRAYLEAADAWDIAQRVAATMRTLDAAGYLRGRVVLAPPARPSAAEYVSDTLAHFRAQSVKRREGKGGFRH